MPILHPKELWVASERWERYVTDGIMFTLKDRKGTELCLGPDARGGHHRLREHVDQQLQAAAGQPLPDPGQVSRRDPAAVRADARARVHHDGRLLVRRRFHGRARRVLRKMKRRLPAHLRPLRAEVHGRAGRRRRDRRQRQRGVHGARRHRRGRDPATATSCGYAANVEKAELVMAASPDAGEPAAMEKRETPDVRTVEQLEAVLRLPPLRMAKTLLYQGGRTPTSEELVAVMMRGDLELNEVKLRQRARLLGGRAGRRGRRSRKTTGAEVGFAGPVGLSRGRAGCWPIVIARGPGQPVVRLQRDRLPLSQRQPRPRHAPAGVPRPAAGAGRRGLSNVREAAQRGARHRGRPHLQARHQVLEEHGRDLHVAERQADAVRDGLLRDRREPDRRGRGRAVARRQGHHLAAADRAVPGAWWRFST